MKIEIVKHPNHIEEIIVSSPKEQSLSFLNVGAVIYRWKTPQKKEIVARYLHIEDYLTNKMSFGATVGMNSGRIPNCRFDLGRNHYQILGEHPHFLHGGDEQLACRFFEYETRHDESMAEIKFIHSYTHPILPGTQKVLVTYRVWEGKLSIHFDVESDELMLCNLTNHSYFNLDGDFQHPIDSHELSVSSDRVVLVDDELLGGEILDVGNTEFDFRVRKPIMPVVTLLKTKFPGVNGLDHFFLFKHHVVELYSSISKTMLTVTTSLPGVTIYSTNFPNLQLTQTSKPLGLHDSICIEPQFQSNGVNDHRFEAGLVSPDNPYHHYIEYVLEESES